MEIIDFRIMLRTKESLREVVPEPAAHFAAYLDIFNMRQRLSFLSMEEHVEEMEKYGIARGVIFPSNEAGNAAIESICRAYPNNFMGLARVDLSKSIMHCLDVLKRCYEESGLCGLDLSPYITGIPADDARLYPLYALSAQMNKVVVISTSQHYNPGCTLEVADPNHLDRVAVHFPELKLVMSHAGHGFGLLPLATAQRHPNVYLEFSALKPQYVEPSMLAAVNSVLREKCLFGTDYPVLDFSVVDQWKKAIRPENHQRFFSGNAARLLGLDMPAEIP